MFRATAALRRPVITTSVVTTRVPVVLREIKDMEKIKTIKAWQVEKFISEKSKRLKCNVCGSREWMSPAETDLDEETIPVRCCDCGHIVHFDTDFVAEWVESQRSPKLVKSDNPSKESGNSRNSRSDRCPKQSLRDKFFSLFR